MCKHLLIDIGLISLAFVLATSVRFEAWLPPPFFDYLPAVLVAAGASGAMLYIFGLYSRYAPRRKRFVQNSFIIVAFIMGIICSLGYGSVDFSARIGRGVMLIGAPISLVCLFAHHFYSFRYSGRFREKLACLIVGSMNERQARLIQSVEQSHTEFVGLITIDGYKAENSKDVIGCFHEIESVLRDREINCLICLPGTLGKEDVLHMIRRLRYSGVNVFSLADMCEDLFQAVPLQLVTNEWLLHCSGQPRLFYMRKLKRIFDITVSLFCILISFPLVVLAICLVRLTSRGPVFYIQKRCGRFGRQFSMVKLRTMKVDAELHGARWSSEDDDRLTPVGAILRKFRIDEIPQLWMVLKGDMSFVGPRPERQEFIDRLSLEIPLFSERVMVQPGITGWAQVNYPYGSTMEDAKRKLEYDLYYMKNMGILLDCFVLLDTARTVFLGGAKKDKGLALERFSNSLCRVLNGNSVSEPSQ